MFNLIRALRHRPFALLWSGQTISRIGDFLYQITLAWWVLEATGSATAMATVLIFSFTPMLVFLLFGGVAVDRYPRVPLMLISDVVRGVIVAGIAFLAFMHTLQLWHIYAASLLFGIVDAVFQPAYMAMVPSLVPQEDLTSANALTSFGSQGGRILGPALGALIIKLGGTPIAFAINAASFGISALCLLPLLKQQQAPPEPTEGERSTIISDIRMGIATVAQTPWIWLTIATFALSNVTLSGPYNVAIPFLVDQVFAGNVTYLGWLYAMFPIGYVLGALWLGRQHSIKRYGWLIYGGGIVAGIGMAVLGGSVPISFMLVAALINGAALEISGQLWITLLQARIPNALLGRVSSIDMVGSYAFMPIGYALTGWATNTWNAATVCLLGGVLTVVFNGLGLLHPAIRKL